MQDAWRAYLELALGVTEASRRRAEQVARQLLVKGEATAAQLQGTAEQLLAAGKANREGLTRLVRYEVERALGTVGLATAEQVDGLATRIRELERLVRQQAEGSPVGYAEAGPPPAAARKTTARKTTARKTVAKKSVAKKTAPTKAVAKKAAPSKAAPKKAAPSRAAAEQAPAGVEPGQQSAGRSSGSAGEDRT